MTTPRTSLRQAINLQCKACIYDPFADGKWRQQVASCNAFHCPLFEVRPLPRPVK